jgi:plastocyanin
VTRFWPLGVALLVALALSTTSTFAATDMVSINIVDAPRPQAKWGYAPTSRRVQPGTWVTWSNSGQDAHTVTASDGSFDSGNLDPSEGFSWYFDQAGTFTYLCALHPWMTGKIVVGDSVAPAVPMTITAPPDPGAEGDSTPLP